MYCFLHNYTLRNHHLCLTQVECCCLGGMNYSFVTGGQTTDIKMTVDHVQKCTQWCKTNFSEFIFHHYSELSNIWKKKLCHLNKIHNCQFEPWAFGIVFQETGWVGCFDPLWPTPWIYNWACWNNSWSLATRLFSAKLTELYGDKICDLVFINPVFYPTELTSPVHTGLCVLFTTADKQKQRM